MSPYSRLQTSTREECKIDPNKLESLVPFTTNPWTEPVSGKIIQDPEEALKYHKEVHKKR